MSDKFTNNVRARLYKQGYQGFTKDDYTSAAIAVECDDLDNPTKEQLSQAVDYLREKATNRLTVTDEPVEETFLVGAEDVQPEVESNQLAVAEPNSQIVLTDLEKQALVRDIAQGAGIELKAADEIDNESSFQRLEYFKTVIKRQGLVTRTERDLQSHESERILDKQKKDIDRRADNQLVQERYISLEELQQQYQRQSELEDLQFSNTVKQFAVADSVADKSIADNLRDKAKADQERSKIEGKTKSAIANDNQQSVDQQRANSLIEALKGHEDGWLWKIIDNLTPLWLIGRQGSGKTYTSAAIALVRKHCLGIPIYYLIDRHATGDNSKAWRYLDTQNIAESELEIGTALDTLCEHWLLRIKGKNDLEQPATITPEQVLIDEYTNLKSLIGEPAEKFYKLHLTDTRKAKVYVTGITHNDTNSSYPEGTQAMREAGTILIQKFSANGKTPLSRVKIIRGLLDDNGEEYLEAERTLPSWFNPEDIYNHFNGKPISFDT